MAVVGEYDDVGGVYAVTVYRLFGNSRSEYTLTRIVKSAPANPPLEMLSDYQQNLGLGAPRDPGEKRYSAAEEEQAYDPTRLTLPYRFMDTAYANNPAVQTVDGIFFAVNPTVHIFKALFAWCDDVQALPFPQTQLIVLSKYAPIQITRLRPDVAGNELEAASIELPGSMTEVFRVNEGLDCADVFTLAVSSMEVMDAFNIVVTVVHTTLAAARRLTDGT
eukprot:1301864-Rhodomonas_salina.1